MRAIYRNVPELFKPYPWKIVEDKWDIEKNKNNETIFTVANGYLGIRGYFEEHFGDENIYSDRTAMINGVYEYFDYHYIWCRPGFPERYHAIVRQADPFDISIFADGEKITAAEPGAKNYVRFLDMKTGAVTRSFSFNLKNGKTINCSFIRFASQNDKHLAVDRITIKSESDADIVFTSRLSYPESYGCSKEEIGGAGKDIFTGLGANVKNEVQCINYRTNISAFEISVSAKDVFNRRVETQSETEDNAVKNCTAVHLEQNKEITMDRFIVYATNRDFNNFREETYKKVCEGAKKGFNRLMDENRLALDKFWKDTDICIDEDDAVLQGLRFSALQIFQSTGKDSITNISANGLSGTGYSGHTFWDTEIFMMPMYIYTNPEIAKKLISYRYNILDKARERARQMDDQGALFSWNSINGEECGHVFEAATAQYHINNDIFYSIYRYMEATEDEGFLVDVCAEILFEISKCMAHRGSFIENKNNKFCINVVCGPDEYNPVVDNNMYTNLLTQKQLYYTLGVAELLRTKYPVKYKELTEKCKIDGDELALWKKAADNMYIPYSDKLGMYMQDDNFIYKDPIDIESIKKEKLPLLTHLHPLNLWRYQVCKQADIVLLTFLCSDYFTKQERKKIFEYYEPKTIHDSSLSAGIHSIVACDIGDTQNAYGYLCQAARMDLDNVNGNTFFGLHAACMGASWMMIVNGCAGLRIYDQKLHFRPFIYDQWKSYSFKVLFKGTRLFVCVDKDKTTYEIVEGDKIEIEHYDKCYLVDKKLIIENMEGKDV